MVKYPLGLSPLQYDPCSLFMPHIMNYVCVCSMLSAVYATIPERLSTVSVISGLSRMGEITLTVRNALDAARSHKIRSGTVAYTAETIEQTQT